VEIIKEDLEFHEGSGASISIYPEIDSLPERSKWVSDLKKFTLFFQ